MCGLGTPRLQHGRLACATAVEVLVRLLEKSVQLRAQGYAFELCGVLAVLCCQEVGVKSHMVLLHRRIPAFPLEGPDSCLLKGPPVRYYSVVEPWVLPMLVFCGLVRRQTARHGGK